MGRVREEKRREEERRSEKRKSQKKQDQGARKGRTEKLRKTVFFQCFVALQARKISKSRLAKAAGAEPFGEMRDEKLHAAVAQQVWKSKC